MITKIGIVAGEIWNYLDQNNGVTLSDLVSHISKSKDLVLMSLGWLAREGHVVLSGEGDYIINLRK